MKFIALLLMLWIRPLVKSSPSISLLPEAQWANRAVVALLFAGLAEWLLYAVSSWAYGLFVLIAQCGALFFLVVRTSPVGFFNRYITEWQRGDYEAGYLHLVDSGLIKPEDIESSEQLNEAAVSEYVLLMFNRLFLPLMFFWLLGVAGLIIAVLVFNVRDRCVETPLWFKRLRHLLFYPLLFSYYLCGHSQKAWPFLMSSQTSDLSLVQCAMQAADSEHAQHPILAIRTLNERVLVLWMVLMGVAVILVGVPGLY